MRIIATNSLYCLMTFHKLIIATVAFATVALFGACNRQPIIR